jgi:hypothetical protein
MLLQTQSVEEGVYLDKLDPGAVLDVETTSRHYTIKYVGGDEILISGHPSLCPLPVRAQLEGSLGSRGEIRLGFLGRGMRLAFRRLTDQLPLITSAIQSIRQERQPLPRSA